MKAIAFTHQGTPDVLKMMEVSKPQPSSKQILVKVHAVSVNPIDCKVRSYLMPKQDPNNYWNDKESPHPKILGWDASGVIEQLGSDANKFKVGDEVYFSGVISLAGYYSQFCVVDERLAALKPKILSFEAAAALPLTTLTAWEALEEGMNVEKNSGKTVLIIGGAGGVGAIAIQIVKAWGLKVIATASRPETVDYCKKLGADIVINHQQDLRTQLDQNNITSVDHIFCTAEPEHTIAQWYGIIKACGTAGIILDPSPSIYAEIGKFLCGPKRVSLSREVIWARGYYNEQPEKQGNILQRLTNLVDQKKVVSTATQVMDWENMAEAHKLVETSKTIGKIVLRVN